MGLAGLFAGSFALIIATVFGLRRHYMTPLTTSGAPGPRDWVVGTAYVDPIGHGLTQNQGHDLYMRFVAQLRDPNTELPPGAFRHWLEAQHYTVLDNYHPASRFWPFQLIETGWMGPLTLLLGIATVWLIRRRTN